MKRAYFVAEIMVKDPDTKGKVTLSVYKHEGGGMFAVDASFLDQTLRTDDFDRPIVPDVFSNNDSEGDAGIDEVILFD